MKHIPTLLSRDRQNRTEDSRNSINSRNQKSHKITNLQKSRPKTPLETLTFQLQEVIYRKDFTILSHVRD